MKQSQRCDRHEQHETAGLREEKELEGGVAAILMPPDGDEEVHRQEHDFPEKEKEEKVQSEEYADDTAHDEQQVEIIKPLSFSNFRPGGHHRDEAEHIRQDDQDETETIQAKMQIDPPLWDPLGMTLQHPLSLGRVLRNS